MKILAVTRNTHEYPDLPPTFTVDQAPVEDSPTVSEINFYELGYNNGKGYRGCCYVVKFTKSNIRTVIPAHEVVEVAIEAEAAKKSNPAKAVSAAPEMN